MSLSACSWGRFFKKRSCTPVSSWVSFQVFLLSALLGPLHTHSFDCTPPTCDGLTLSVLLPAQNRHQQVLPKKTSSATSLVGALPLPAQHSGCQQAISNVGNESCCLVNPSHFLHAVSVFLFSNCTQHSPGKRSLRLSAGQGRHSQCKAAQI